MLQSAIKLAARMSLGRFPLVSPTALGSATSGLAGARSHVGRQALSLSGHPASGGGSGGVGGIGRFSASVLGLAGDDGSSWRFPATPMGPSHPNRGLVTPIPIGRASAGPSPPGGSPPLALPPAMTMAMARLGRTPAAATPGAQAARDVLTTSPGHLQDVGTRQPATTTSDRLTRKASPDPGPGVPPSKKLDSGPPPLPVYVAACQDDLPAAANEDGAKFAVEVPPGTTHIEDRAFHECEGLTQITLPPGLTHIGEWAFQHCEGLTQVTLPHRRLVTLPPGLTHIDATAFGSNVILRQAKV